MEIKIVRERERERLQNLFLPLKGCGEAAGGHGTWRRESVAVRWCRRLTAAWLFAW